MPAKGPVAERPLKGREEPSHQPPAQRLGGFGARVHIPQRRPDLRAGIPPRGHLWELWPPGHTGGVRWVQHPAVWVVGTPGSCTPVSGLNSWPHNFPPHWKQNWCPHPANGTKPATPRPHVTQLHASSFKASRPHQGHACTVGAPGCPGDCMVGGGAGNGEVRPGCSSPSEKGPLHGFHLLSRSMQPQDPPTVASRRGFGLSGNGLGQWKACRMGRCTLSGSR